MAHIGIITAPTIGHVNPFILIGKELVNRGHQITFFNIEDMEEKVTAEGLGFCSIGKGLIPRGAIHNLQSELGKHHGFSAMRIWQQSNRRLIQVMLSFLPVAVKERHVDLLLVDESDAAGGSVADALQIPYVTVTMGNSLCWEEGIPPVFSSWQYEDSPSHNKRNLEAMHKIVGIEFKPLIDSINHFRGRHQLPLFNSYSYLFPASPLAHIAQMPSFFDFPRKELPPWFHYVGPFRGKFTKEIAFPWEKLNGKPVIYASLGTVVNYRPSIFYEIADACKDIDMQLVISLGTPIIPEGLENLPGDPLLVPYAPQFELMQKAALCITHAGLNTVLDALGNGVPLVAIPISFDQPGTGSRITYHRLGESVSLSNISVKDHLKNIIHQVLGDESYANNAREFARKLQTLDGLNTAVNMIVQVLHTNTPIYNNQHHHSIL